MTFINELKQGQKLSDEIYFVKKEGKCRCQKWPGIYKFYSDGQDRNRGCKGLGTGSAGI
jgi:hypothetical protein